ncbi:miscellaneous; unknown [plant metagenome]|uniref:N-acetyltransferase domain-containing protein n=1 Tax=plant metagenome TaxID=1297885 RepID=A0A484R341_9ZZZZ
MTLAPQYRFQTLRSADDEAAFFAQMGPFFASRNVRRECGGYALNDGPCYRWLVVQRVDSHRVLGFISVEQRDGLLRIREGYLRPEARGRGLFRALRDRVLAQADSEALDCVACVPRASAALLAPHGFVQRASRGAWTTLERKAHAADHRPGEPGRSPVQGA